MLGYRIPSDFKNDVSKYSHNWKHPAYFTMHPGLAYVTHHRHLNVGDRVRGTVAQLVQSQPMLGPLMQGFQMITIATFTPDSIIYGWMRNGVRYKPEDWSKFDKWFFNPVSSNFKDASIGSTQVGVSFFDAATGDTINSYWLNPGLTARATSDYSYSTFTSQDFYDLWQTPYCIGSTVAGSVKSIFYDNPFQVVGRGGLADCIGIPPGTVAPLVSDNPDSPTPVIFVPSLCFSVAPYVAYFLSTYYYLANMQEPYMYYSYGLYSLSQQYWSYSQVVNNFSTLNFNQIMIGVDPNNFIASISSLQQKTQIGNSDVMDVYNGAMVDSDNPDFFGWLLMSLQSYGGLFSVPYRPDFFNNIIQIGDSPTVNIPVTEVSGDGGTYQMAIPDLRYYTKWQNVLDRVFVGSGRFGDQLRTLMGTNSNPYTNKPDFLGIWQASLDPVNTVSLAAGENSDSERSTTGQMFARLDGYSDFNRKSIDYYCKESGTLMFITFIVPRPAYSQGVHPDLSVLTFADEFNPEMKGLGFQSVPRYRYSTLPQSFATGSPWTHTVQDVDPNSLAVGDTVAFDWLKTDYPRLHGEFSTAGYFEYWTLRRTFTSFFHYVDLSNKDRCDVSEYYGTYINPLAWQYIFQTQSYMDPNFFVGMNFDLRVTSAVPAGYMPYLGR